jgi:hypothetical protein
LNLGLVYKSTTGKCIILDTKAESKLITDIGETETLDKCRAYCDIESTCTSYDWTSSTRICRWYTESLFQNGNDVAGSTCGRKVKSDTITFSSLAGSCVVHDGSISSINADRGT